MSETTSTTNLDCPIDILGQQPLLKIYTQILLAFTVPDASAQSAIIDTLKRGLERLSESFPWVAGQVVNEGASEGDSGVYKIKSLDKTPHLVVKDLSNDPSIPPFEEYRHGNFPMTLLDEQVLCPRPTLPGGPSYLEGLDPVFLVQATFVKGGLLLSFLGHHMTMDMTGQGQVIELLSKSCRGEPFTAEEIAAHNIDRSLVIPFFDDSYDPAPDLAKQIRKPLPAASADTQTSPSPMSWVNYTFSASSLATLKSVATSSLTTGFVSTDDALSALIWQSVTRARLPRLTGLDPSSTSATFARAVDVRRYLGVTPLYPGLLQNMAYSNLTIQELIDAPVGFVAAQLRLALDGQKLAHATRALGTLMHRAKDKSAVSFTAAVDTSVGIMLSSWAKEKSYALDFGLGLGLPVSVRRPRFTPVEGLLYLLPKTLDGEVGLAVSLRDEDLERLKGDKVFMEYAKYIG